jgi:hypothetical protein
MPNIPGSITQRRRRDLFVVFRPEIIPKLRRSEIIPQRSPRRGWGIFYVDGSTKIPPLMGLVKIAQRFSAGIRVTFTKKKSRQGRKKTSVVPDGTGESPVRMTQP